MQEMIKNFVQLNKISEFKKGQPFMVECFEYWCPPCRKAIPHIYKLSQKYKNVYIVSVAQQDQDQVQKLIDHIPLMKNYNISFDSTGELGQFNSDHNVEGIPHCYIFDKQGELIYNGHPMNSKVEQILQQINDINDEEYNLIEEQQEDDE